MTPGTPAVRSSLVDGKNKSRAGELRDTEQSGLSDFGETAETGDDSERYDCRQTYRNFELESQEGETANFRCKSWDCYCCAHRMRMNLVEELDRLIEERPELRRLLTLTLDEDRAPDGQEDQHKYLTERFNALRTELNDRYDGLSYVWIREEGDSGNPHLHLLVDRYMDQYTLSNIASRVGLGEVVDIRRVNARNAARYLTKYLTKGALYDLPKGARRYGSSEDISLAVRGPNEDTDGEWTLLMDDYRNKKKNGDGPLRRSVQRPDFMLQRQHGGPVGLDPPD